MIDLVAEHYEAICALDRRDKLLLHHRIPQHLLDLGLIGVAEIELVGGALYEPAPLGDRAYIIRVCEPDPLWGEIVDLLAWHPAAPDRWALRKGAVSVLGAMPAAWLSETTRIARTPLAWLRGGCQGICILTSDLAERQSVVLDCCAGGIEAEDIDHAIDLRRLAERPLLVPEISVGGGRP